MNINAIKGVCHRGKRATIYRATGGGGQWISNGSAAYRVRGIEIESPEALMELWNLSEKARSKAVIREDITSDRRFRPTVGDEELLTLLGAAGVNEMKCYIALGSARGVIWIDAEWLKPLRIEYAHYCARWDGERPLVAVYEDMASAEALILPVSDGEVEGINESARKMSARPFLWGQTDDAMDDMLGQTGEDGEEGEAEEP